MKFYCFHLFSYFFVVFDRIQQRLKGHIAGFVHKISILDRRSAAKEEISATEEVTRAKGAVEKAESEAERQSPPFGSLLWCVCGSSQAERQQRWELVWHQREVEKLQRAVSRA